MAENSKPGEEIPAFRISEKKVDDSWKEEIRREREKAAQAASAPQPAAAGEPAKTQSAEPADTAAKQAPKEAPAKKAAPATPEEQQAKIFLTFLAGLAQQALMQLGDIPSPFSGQREVDLQGARYTIELLNVLQVKTKGNLNTEEDESLAEAIGDLKMRFVEVANEVQRQMAAQAQKARGPMRPGPGGTIPGPGFGKRS